MSRDDVTRIKVGGKSIGVISLKPLIERIAKEYADRPDNEIVTELVGRLSRKNYIPERAKAAYGKALLREFNKFLGRPHQEDVPEGLDIKVLGPGCANCDRLEREVMEVMAEMNLAASIDHVTDIKEIGRYGLMGTPALIINGKVMSIGTVPAKSKIKAWLGEFA